jgi:hypothetical protein
MKAKSWVMILGLALLAQATNGSATEVNRPELSRAVSAPQARHLVTDDKRLGAIIQERLNARGNRKAPAAICATGDQGWSCAPASALRDLKQLEVADVRIQDQRGYGRLADSGGSRTGCRVCERDSDDEPFVCSPPGCDGTVDAPRSIDLQTTPRDRMTTPQREVTPRVMPREMQGQGNIRRRPDD